MMLNTSLLAPGAISYGRVIWIGCAVCAGIAGGYFGQPMIHDNTAATSLIAMVLSIMVGVMLVPMIHFYCIEMEYHGKQWRCYAVRHRNLCRRLARQKYLCIFCFLTIGSLLVTELGLRHVAVSTLLWMEQIYLGMSITVFMLLLALPGQLMTSQLAMFDDRVEHYRHGGTE